MVELKLKKINWQRRRFIRSESLKELSDWSDVFEDLKKQILTETVFQLVGLKTIVEIEAASGLGHVLVEVVGTPQVGFPSVDMEACEVLSFDYQASAFDVDFVTLQHEAKAIRNGIHHPLRPLYHIVFDKDHLSLHFFIQNDYIQA